jgi:hypothetical protein
MPEREEVAEDGFSRAGGVDASPERDLEQGEPGVHVRVDLDYERRGPTADVMELGRPPRPPQERTPAAELAPAPQYEHDRVVGSTTSATGAGSKEPASPIDVHPELRRERGTVHDAVES